MNFFLLSIFDELKALKQYIDPEAIIQWAGELSPYVLFAIIFAETGLMVGFFLPGDSLLFIAGLFCYTGIIPMHVFYLMLLLIAAAIIGDQVGYMIGKKIGRSLFTRPESLFFKPQYVQQTRKFYDKHGAKTIIIGRFVPIIRTFAPVVAGVTEIEYKKFTLYNVTGGILWIVSMTLLGYLPVYFLGEQFAKNYIRPNIGYITIIIIFLSIVPIIKTAWQEWREKRASQNISAKHNNN
ncbi:MAG: VTT domain-containing protein [Bacteroidia bacterium]|nr:VTT domain-containing protein [Bacteroidia bacterium]MDW8159272.1 VTT domain-containing protein [Bacteroidia bacterium]